MGYPVNKRGGWVKLGSESLSVVAAVVAVIFAGVQKSENLGTCKSGKVKSKKIK